MGRRKIPIKDRLAKFSQPQPNGCVLFTGRRKPAGYGFMMVSIDGIKRVRYAHRLAFEVAHGPIPSGMFICHHCDTPACINVEHLFMGTHLDNMADMRRKGRGSGNYAVHDAPRGEAHPCAILDERTVREIRLRYTGRRGEIAAMGREYGLRAGTVAHVVRRETWRHVV